MKHKLLSSTAAVLMLAAATACNDAKEFNLNSGALYTTTPITIHAIQYDTHSGVDSVMVEIVGRNTTALSDAAGCVTFDLGVGTYEVRLERNGYLPIIQKFDVELANEQSATPILKTNLTDIHLYPLTGSVSGYVTRVINEQPGYQAQARIDVDIQFPDNAQTDALYTATTDDNGAYRIDRLPEGITLLINGYYLTQEQGSNFVYEGSATVDPLRPDIIVKAPTISLTRMANNYSHDILNLPSSPLEPLTITFPVAADVEKINHQDILVSRGNNNVGITTAWSNADRTLTINTVDPDGWSDDPSAIYNFMVNVPNIEGGYLFSSDQFNVAPEMGQIANIGAAFDAATLMISWPKLSNVLKYNIYLKVSGEQDYRLLTWIDQSADNSESIEIPALDLIALNQNAFGIYYFKIVGLNDRFEGDLSTANTIIVPYINPDDVRFSTASDTLYWTIVEGVTEYQIYEKGTDNSYALISKVPAPIDGSTMVEVRTTGLFQTTGSHTVKVIGVMDGTRGNLNMANEVLVY